MSYRLICKCFIFISYRDDCESCMKFQAKWEYIASQLKGRINLARVNIKDDGISTGSRFDVSQVPAFLL
jgi:thioredoxin-like negative regulator of GroEL